MKTITSLITAFVLSVSVATAQAQQVSGFVESWNNISGTGVTPQVDVSVEGPLKGQLSWNVWTLNSAKWSEALVGLTLKPAKWIDVSASIGLEHDDNPFRAGQSIWLGKGRWSLLSIHEEGGSGYWYRYVGKAQVTKTIAVGMESRRFFGTGPYIEKKLGKVSLWGAYAIGDNRGVAGARLNF